MYTYVADIKLSASYAWVVDIVRVHAECMTTKFLNMSVCIDDMLFMTLLDTMMYVDGAYNERTAIYYK